MHNPSRRANIRVLTLSSLYPDESRPTSGLFVERQTRGLAARSNVAVQVVAPVGVPPWPLRMHRHYRRLAKLPPLEQRGGLRVHRPFFTIMPGISARFMPRMMANGLLPLLRIIRRDFPFNVIDAEFFWPDGAAAAIIGKTLDVPVSIKVRDSDIHYWSKRPGCADHMRTAAEAADGLLAENATLSRDMARLGMAEEKIRTHYTGVDLDRFTLTDRDAAKARLGISGPLLVAVGDLVERKGQRLALDAMRHLPGVSLMIAGEGPDHNLLRQRIASFGLEDRVRLLGALPHDALPPLLAAADVMVLPSASEGLANAWVEALACGTPIVIADVGGARELLDRPEAGALVPRDAEAIAVAVRTILADPPAREAVRKTAKRFTWDANSAALEDHLRAVISRPYTRSLGS